MTGALPLALEPHHDGSALYVSHQQPQLGDVVRVRVRIPNEYGAVAAVMVRSNPDREPRFTPAHLLVESAGVQW